ncbi:unannotated protein [freshwater metagenome]|uniref:Unannotated protein n=1 Tax=freshwater metagenome TaxID=449393 RepID=A0A6J6DST5_9ZZZZ
MAKTNGERGEALLDVRHLAGIQLDIGATNADSFNLNDELPRSGNRVSKLVHLSDTGRGDNERAHYLAAWSSANTR